MSGRFSDKLARGVKRRRREAGAPTLRRLNLAGASGNVTTRRQLFSLALFPCKSDRGKQNKQQVGATLFACAPPGGQVRELPGAGQEFVAARLAGARRAFANSRARARAHLTSAPQAWPARVSHC